jgi:hypothetical protein
MPRVQTTKTLTFTRDDVEQIAYIVGQLETLLVNSHDELATRVTESWPPQPAPNRCLPCQRDTPSPPAATITQPRHRRRRQHKTIRY